MCIVYHGKEEKVDRNRFNEVRYYFGVDLTSYLFINATFKASFRAQLYKFLHQILLIIILRQKVQDQLFSIK